MLSFRRTVWARAITLVAVGLFCQPPAVQAAETISIGDKTLVVWATPANLTQRGGSAITIEKSNGVFDGIVYGEVAAATWMPGSESRSRTPKDPQGFPSETASSTAASSSPVQIAVVYQDHQITIYRNGKKYADYTADTAAWFDTKSQIFFGLRHRKADAENSFFEGSIDDARIYNQALDPSAIAALVPNQLSDPKPLAWWNFEDGVAVDRMNRFTASTLFGSARLADGKLVLSKGGFMMASDKSPRPPVAGSLSAMEAAPIARDLRESLLNDPHRPGYHFVIPEGTGMPFDPNGAIFYKGRYHMFYIFQDKRGHNWGHVSSTDLFHWRHHPTRLVTGMFSGNCFLNKDGIPTMCYHQVGQGNAMAVALDDDLNEWKKLDTNPITPKTSEGDKHHGKFRSWDPFGWLEGNNYYAIFGGDRAAVAKSTSLRGQWSYTGSLLANTVEGVSIDEDISCADFYKLGNRHMLLCISHRLGARYYLGDWKNEQFHPTFHQQMSWVDNAFFAPESLVDDRGRRIMWAWVKDRSDWQMRTDAGWSGTMSLPRVLSLADDGSLRMNVPKEIENLRYNASTFDAITLAADSETDLNVRGDSIELALTIEPGNAKQFGIKVRCSPDGEEETLVFYDAEKKKLTIDTRKSSLKEGPKSVEAGPLELQDGEPLKLRVFIDKSIIEVFANNRQAVMRRVYPTRSDSVGVKLFSNGGACRVRAGNAWDISPSNPH